MLDFFCLSVLFYFFNIYFIFFLILFSFLLLRNFSWGGLFFFGDSNIFLVLVVIRLFILGLILLREKNNVILFLSEALILVSVMFFLPSSLLMFYMFFELSIVPILVMILGYGAQIEKISSAYYLIVYASFCSLPFLYILMKGDFLMSFVYIDLYFSWELVFILSLGFLIKFPVFFLHLWLPKAHVEAPTTASMLLAGLLLKLGTCGFLRLIKSFNFYSLNYWFLISFLGIVLASLVCAFQSDAKSLAAYSSVSHMGFVLLVLLFVFFGAKTSGLFLMLSHGYTSALLFFMVGEFFHFSGTRLIYYMNRFLSRSVFVSVFFIFVMVSNMGVPPSVSFFSEFVGISVSLVVSTIFFFVLFFYFFFAFYYCAFFLTNLMMGKNYGGVRNLNFFFSFPLILMGFNVFWVSLLF